MLPAATKGGAVHVQATAQVQMHHCLVNANKASFGAGINLFDSSKGKPACHEWAHSVDYVQASHHCLHDAGR
jgi:hypothetical protein